MIQVQETMAHKYNRRRRISPNYSKVDRGLTLMKGTNSVEVLPAVVRAWHETTGPSGYTPNEIVFVHTTILKSPLLQSLRPLPKTSYTIPNGVRSFFSLHIEL